MPRLIDANALLQKLHRMIDYCKADNKVTGLTALFQVGDAIMDCKTVDAVEVVHGRWIDEYPYARCSVCNAEWINCTTDNDPKLFYYCPNCGAKMDGDGND